MAGVAPLWSAFRCRTGRSRPRCRRSGAWSTRAGTPATTYCSSSCTFPGKPVTSGATRPFLVEILTSQLESWTESRIRTLPQPSRTRCPATLSGAARPSSGYCHSGTLGSATTSRAHLGRGRLPVPPPRPLTASRVGSDPAGMDRVALVANDGTPLSLRRSPTACSSVTCPAIADVHPNVVSSVHAHGADATMHGCRIPSALPKHRIETGRMFRRLLLLGCSEKTIEPLSSH